MKKLPDITEIKFIKIHRVKSCVGFVSFLYDNRIVLKDIAVHTLYEPKGNVQFRLVYPIDAKDKVIFHPIDKKTQEFIDRKINEFLLTENVIPKKDGNNEETGDKV